MDNQLQTVDLYGAGGHALVVAEILADAGIGIGEVVADFPARRHPSTVGVKPGLSVRDRSELGTGPWIIAIGDNQERARVVAGLGKCDYLIATHPTSFVPSSSSIGLGTVLHHRTHVGRNSVIGQHVIVNTGASVDHDNVIGDFVHISPRGTLCGHVTVGEGTHIGAGATVLPSVKIGKWCKIGAGAVVREDVGDYEIVAGVPARAIGSTAEPATAERAAFDLAFIGSGVSSSFVLLETLERLRQDGPTGTLRVAVMDRSGEFHSGVAYGFRSGQRALTITDLETFVPAEYRSAFTDWLAAQKPEDLERDGWADATWWSEHRSDVEAGRWMHLYAPRGLFGCFLRELVNTRINQAEDESLISVEYFSDEITGVRRSSGQWQIERAWDSPILSRSVLLAPGSPPRQPLFDDVSFQPRASFIEDPYSPSLEATVRQIAAPNTGATTEPTRVLLVGGNATAIEVAYHLSAADGSEHSDPLIDILSPSGHLPAKISPVDQPSDALVPSVTGLAAQPEINADQILTAFEADLASKGQCTPSWEAISAANAILPQMLASLDDDELERFAAAATERLQRLQRRVGGDYSDTTQRAEARDRLRVLGGRFVSAQSVDDGAIVVVETSDGETELGPYRAVVNCTGAAIKHSPLLAQLLEDAVVRPTSEGQGIKVDEDLAAADGLFVVGPLLAGNVVGEKPIWHLEHCGRIAELAGTAAEAILTQLRLGMLTTS